MTGDLNDFDPITVQLVSGSDWEPLWDQLVRNYHYLGYQRLLGHGLKYVAFINERPVAALSWSAPALKLAARDCFIGWSAEQRKRHLRQVAGNSRFLVMPWVKIPNMASQVLALNIARLPLDWQRQFNHRLLLYKGRGPRPKKVTVLPGQSKAQSVAQIAKSKQVSWEPVMVAEGAKGPIIAEVARMRIYLSRDGLPVGRQQWLFLRKDTDGQVKYAISNAPKDIPITDLIKASTMRWPIEQCFHEGKDQVGMDYYEHRSWPAWHRHMIYVFLALHFLLRMRLHFKKKPSVDCTFGSEAVIGNAAPQIINLGGGHGNC